MARLDFIPRRNGIGYYNNTDLSSIFAVGANADQIEDRNYILRYYNQHRVELDDRDNFKVKTFLDPNTKQVYIDYTGLGDKDRLSNEDDLIDSTADFNNRIQKSWISPLTALGDEKASDKALEAAVASWREKRENSRDNLRLKIFQNIVGTETTKYIGNIASLVGGSNVMGLKNTAGALGSEVLIAKKKIKDVKSYLGAGPLNLLLNKGYYWIGKENFNLLSTKGAKPSGLSFGPKLKQKKLPSGNVGYEGSIDGNGFSTKKDYDWEMKWNGKPIGVKDYLRNKAFDLAPINKIGEEWARDSPTFKKIFGEKPEFGIYKTIGGKKVNRFAWGYRTWTDEIFNRAVLGGIYVRDPSKGGLLPRKTLMGWIPTNEHGFRGKMRKWMGPDKRQKKGTIQLGLEFAFNVGRFVAEKVGNAVIDTVTKGGRAKALLELRNTWRGSALVSSGTATQLWNGSKLVGRGIVAPLAYSIPAGAFGGILGYLMSGGNTLATAGFAGVFGVNQALTTALKMSAVPGMYSIESLAMRIKGFQPVLNANSLVGGPIAVGGRLGYYDLLQNVGGGANANIVAKIPYRVGANGIASLDPNRLAVARRMAANANVIGNNPLSRGAINAADFILQDGFHTFMERTAKLVGTVQRGLITGSVGKFVGGMLGLDPTISFWVGFSVPFVTNYAVPLLSRTVFSSISKALANSQVFTLMREFPIFEALGIAQGNFWLYQNVINPIHQLNMVTGMGVGNAMKMWAFGGQLPTQIFNVGDLQRLSNAQLAERGLSSRQIQNIRNANPGSQIKVDYGHYAGNMNLGFFLQGVSNYALFYLPGFVAINQYVVKVLSKVGNVGFAGNVLQASRGASLAERMMGTGLRWSMRPGMIGTIGNNLLRAGSWFRGGGFMKVINGLKFIPRIFAKIVNFPVQQVVNIFNAPFRLAGLAGGLIGGFLGSAIAGGLIAGMGVSAITATIALTIGTITGIVLGTATAALLTTFVPGLGTGIGYVIGQAVGQFIGNLVGNAVAGPLAAGFMKITGIDKWIRDTFDKFSATLQALGALLSFKKIWDSLGKGDFGGLLVGIFQLAMGFAAGAVPVVAVVTILPAVSSPGGVPGASPFGVVSFANKTLVKYDSTGKTLNYQIDFDATSLGVGTKDIKVKMEDKLDFSGDVNSINQTSVSGVFSSNVTFSNTGWTRPDENLGDFSDKNMKLMGKLTYTVNLKDTLKALGKDKYCNTVSVDANWTDSKGKIQNNKEDSRFVLCVDQNGRIFDGDVISPASPSGTAVFAGTYYFPVDPSKVAGTQCPFGGYSHKGVGAVDLAGGGNPPIFVWRDGIIRSFGFGLYGEGLFVSVYHTDSTGQKIISYYYHMSSISSGLVVGQPITGGTQIGNMGKTGRSSGEHLHFELKNATNGTTIDVCAQIDCKIYKATADPYVSCFK